MGQVDLKSWRRAWIGCGLEMYIEYTVAWRYDTAITLYPCLLAPVCEWIRTLRIDEDLKLAYEFGCSEIWFSCYRIGLKGRRP